MKIILLGNCQVQLIALALQEICLGQPIDVECAPMVHLITPFESNDFLNKCALVDLILTQPISDGYRGLDLGTQALKESFPGKVKVFPNIYFEGTLPQFTKLPKYHDVFLNESVGFDTDYHDAVFIALLNIFKDVGSALRKFENLKSLPNFTSTIFSKSMFELKNRELSCDIIVSDIIEREYRNIDLFYTHNHPVNDLIVLFSLRLYEAICDVFKVVNVNSKGLGEVVGKLSYKLDYFSPQISQFVRHDIELNFNRLEYRFKGNSLDYLSVLKSQSNLYADILGNPPYFENHSKINLAQLELMTLRIQ